MERGSLKDKNCTEQLSNLDVDDPRLYMSVASLDRPWKGTTEKVLVDGDS